MTRNYWPTHEWRVLSPQDSGMDGDKLMALDAHIKSQYKNINGIVIVKNGYIVHERYYNGYTETDVHHVASVTKSITSALIGIAIDKGAIKSVDEKVLSFFPDYPCEADDFLKKAVRLKHLLTMTAPFPFSWKEGDTRSHEPLDRLRRQKDWVRYTLDLLGQKGQLGQFQYYTAGTHLLSAIITKATGKTMLEYANQELFRPLGMKEIPDDAMKSFSLEAVFGKEIKGWSKDPQGITAGGFGLTLTPRDMARFGFLYINRGRWEQKQIISKEWILESLGMNANNYGYLWWLRDEKGLFSFSALGSGGNVICCIPEKDIVVAIASEIISNPKDRWPLIETYII
ncbi:serine hydrolase domain-containing protein [Fusibacter bizertensis]